MTSPKRKRVNGFATVTEDGMGLVGSFNEMLHLMVPNLAGKRVLITYTEITPEIEDILKESKGTAWLEEIEE